MDESGKKILPANPGEDLATLCRRAQWLRIMGSSEVEKRYDNIGKSEEDKRLYRGLKLKNGMHVVLISDDDTDISAACMDVNVGFMSEPKELPGLAHFCEHMLSMGTEKYPKENEFYKFLSEHGGFNNAATSVEDTMYYFGLVHTYFKEALDMFSQFFIAPLFSESAVEREVNAIHSEYSKNFLKDSWRFDQLMRSTAKEDHDFNVHGGGNKITLMDIPKSKGINIREELIKFHKKWYSSHLMNLVMLGRESLDELEEMVVKLFADVKRTNAELEEWLECPYGPEHLQLRQNVVPISDERAMQILFPLPDMMEQSKSDAVIYVSHLIGHEGPGSLLSRLHKLGWCSTLHAGLRRGARGFSFFVVKMDLSLDGLQNTDEIITLVFQYINMLKELGPQEWFFKELSDITKMSFRFGDKQRPVEYVLEISNVMSVAPIENVLTYSVVGGKWDPDLINEVLSYLTPEKLRVSVISKDYEAEADETEKWAGIKFKTIRYTKEYIENLKNCGRSEFLHLPMKNEFIPTNFTLHPIEDEASEYPVIIQNSSLSRIWFKQDTVFRLPKIHMKIFFFCPLSYLDPVTFNTANLFQNLVADALSEHVYAIQIAGLNVSLSPDRRGLVLSTSGYSDKQDILLSTIMERMINFQIDHKRFEILKERYIRALNNFHLEQPHIQVEYHLQTLLLDVTWSREELLDACSGVTLESTQEFVPQFLSKIYLEALVHGNVTKEKALELIGIVETNLRKAPNLWPPLSRQANVERLIELKDGTSYTYTVTSEHSNSAVMVYLQCGVTSTESLVLTRLFLQILKEPTFNILRTKEQLGYIVYSNGRVTSCEHGVRIVVQTAHSADYVERRIEAFLASIEKYLDEMSIEEFERHREVEIFQRIIKPKDLSRQTALYWHEIIIQLYFFDRKKAEVEYLRTVTKEDVIKFYRELIAPNAPRRHKLSVHVVPGEGVEQDKPTSDVNVEELLPEPKITLQPTVITDIYQFRNSQPLTPRALPHINVFGSTKSKL